MGQLFSGKDILFFYRHFTYLAVRPVFIGVTASEVSTKNQKQIIFLEKS